MSTVLILVLAVDLVLMPQSEEDSHQGRERARSLPWVGHVHSGDPRSEIEK